MRRHRDPVRPEHGFTLVELLVVVLVLAVLAAIAIPVYLGQQRSARDSSVVSDVGNTAVAASEWVLRNGGSAIAGTADYENAGGRVVRSGTNVVDVTVSASGAYTVCAYASDGRGTYGSNTNAYLYTSESRRGARSTAGCPGDGVPATAATSTAVAPAPAATSSTATTSGTGPIAASPTPTPTAAAWVDCASEWGTCSFTGTRSVRYGLAPSTWVVRTLTNGTPCTNDVFGDPAYGSTKQCQVLQ